ncbi:MAG: hypothetical protein HC880_12255 [Bacteroidia bacterium]|nr:hypothetical protein [Bacteroidia bacterium]
MAGERVRPLMGYGGFFIEPIIQSNKLVHLTIPLMFGAGWVGYIEDWRRRDDFDREDLIDDQVMWVIEPGVNLEINVASFFRFDVGVGYRFTQNADLINTSKNAFEGMNYNVTLKFGRF